MSFLQRVASQARSTMPDIPVARPKGLLPGLLSAALAPIEHAPPAPAPIGEEPRLAPSPVPDAAPERMAPRQPIDAPSALRHSPVAPPAPWPAAVSTQTDFGADPPVVERRARPHATAEESGSSAEPARATSPDQRQPSRSVPAADPGPAPDTLDPQPPRGPVRESALPRSAPQAGPPPGPGPGPAEPPGLATQVADDAGTTPNEPIDRALALRVEPPPHRNEGLRIAEPEAPAPADRPLEEAYRRPVEVLPVAQPLTLSAPPLPPAERALPQRPTAAEKQPVLQIDQIDVVVTDPRPMPSAPARSPFAAVSANRRYLRRL
jgi:hypothetical protein